MTSVTIGNARYSYEPHSPATTVTDYVQRIGATDDWSYRCLQVLDKGAFLLSRNTPSSWLRNVSSAAFQAAELTLVPALWSAVLDAKESVRDVIDLSCAPDGAQARRRIVSMLSNVTGAVGLGCEVSGTFVGLVFQDKVVASDFSNAATGLFLINSTLEAEKAAEDWNAARLAASDLRGAPDAAVAPLVYTQRHALLRLAKSVLEIAAGILALGALLFKGALVSKTVMAVLGLSIAFLALWGMAYKQSMSTQPVEMFRYALV